MNGPKERYSNGGEGKWNKENEDDIVVANERSLATLSSTELLNHQVKRSTKARHNLGITKADQGII